LNPDGTENTDASFIGNRNPFRYRGYYYEKQTNLYFLKSRFYDPEIGRFISPSHLQGYLVAPWHSTAEENIYELKNNAYGFYRARRDIYPETL